MRGSPFPLADGSHPPTCSIFDRVGCGTVSGHAIQTYGGDEHRRSDSPFGSIPCRGRSSTTEMEKPPFSLSKSGAPETGGFVEERAGTWASLARRIRPSRGRPVGWGPSRMENGHG